MKLACLRKAIQFVNTDVANRTLLPDIVLDGVQDLLPADTILSHDFLQL